MDKKKQLTTSVKKIVFEQIFEKNPKKSCKKSDKFCASIVVGKHDCMIHIAIIDCFVVEKFPPYDTNFCIICISTIARWSITCSKSTIKMLVWTIHKFNISKNDWIWFLKKINGFCCKIKYSTLTVIDMKFLQSKANPQKFTQTCVKIYFVRICFFFNSVCTKNYLKNIHFFF